MYKVCEHAIEIYWYLIVHFNKLSYKYMDKIHVVHYNYNYSYDYVILP